MIARSDCRLLRMREGDGAAAGGGRWICEGSLGGLPNRCSSMSVSALRTNGKMKILQKH